MNRLGSGETLVEEGMGGESRVGVNDFCRLGAGGFNHFEILERFHADVGESRLRGAAERPRATDLQIFLRKLKTILRIHHRLKPRHARGASAAQEEEAVRLLVAPGHAAAELVYLRKAKALRALNGDDRGVWDVDPYLNNRR